MQIKLTLERQTRRTLSVLSGISIRQKVILTFLSGFLALTIFLVEYVFHASRQAGIEQMEHLVQMATLNAYNEIEATYRRVDNGELNGEEALAEIRNRIAGPLMELHISTDKSSAKLEKQFQEAVALIDRDALQGIVLRSDPEGNQKGLFQGTPGHRSLIAAIENDGPGVRFRIRNRALVNRLYAAYHRFSIERRAALNETLRIRFIRDLAASSIKIGNDGYAFAIRIYDPEWYLHGTAYPEDYTAEAIEKRYAENFAGLNLTTEQIRNYRSRFGETPAANLAFIENEMSAVRPQPAGAVADIHPYLEGADLDNVASDGVMVARNLVMRREGFYRYSWQNPTDLAPRTKVVFMKTFSHPGQRIRWIVACGVYEDETLAHLTVLHRNLYLISLAVALFLSLGILFFLKVNIMNPLNSLLAGFRRVNEGDLNVRINRAFNDEIGFLARSFNSMVRSIRKSNRALQEHAHTLETRVAERTKELEESLRTVQELKSHQDGDYYLTSLILKPLGENRTSSETVEVNFALKQKKQFSFRKWTGEIGGDLCIARSIKLKQRPYTVFLNADAMGKSMQGAGGALVIGSVFESILDRTLSAFVFKDYYPERWLKNSYMELRKVFESFSGAMGASLVMGLVEDGTGMVYYINAEHPSGVLYRKGKALFISNETKLKRLGVEEDEREVVAVQTLLLRPGDMLFFGSDGKDDIRFNENEALSINEDETLFLRLVETSYGNLGTIFSTIQRLGDIQDDLSILRIHYNPVVNRNHRSQIQTILEEARNQQRAKNNEPAIQLIRSILELDPVHRFALSELINYHVKREEYDDAIQYGETYLDAHPANLEILYTMSFAFRKKHQYTRAIDLGERIYLREPTQIRNLLNLAYCYTRAGNINRAEYFLEKVFSLEPENQSAKRLVDLLQGKTVSQSS